MLDEQITRGKVPRVVITWPQGDLGFWENWANGERRYRDWVTRELVPHVNRRYNTRGCPEGCHLVGISMGGAGALSFALAEPQQWSSVSVLSAPIYHIDEIEELYDSFWLNLIIPVEDIWGPFDVEQAPRRNVYTRWQRPMDVGAASLLFTWGTHDSGDIRASNQRFEAHLKARDISAHTFEYDGDHTWRSWLRVLPEVLALQVARD
jgi:S-formylglutathione hydrolase FrmB